MPITIKEAQLKYKDPNTGDYVPVAAIADYSDIDVQVNGTSVMNDGIANIPAATISQPGVLKASGSGSGLQLDSNGYLKLNHASSSQMKTGTSYYAPITAGDQHESVFYGLAKAAGDSTQSSSDNPAGTYTAEAQSAIKNMIGIKVEDVQIGGVSCVNNGVANLLPASSSTVGVVYTDGWFGTGAMSGKLYINTANDNDVKSATQDYKPVSPSRQHMSAFYGLAKAAGADMASLSSTTVGQYPDAQKVAIQKMLGIYEAPWELIRMDTGTNATEEDVEITVDGNGESFELTDVIVYFTTPQQSTVSGKGGYGRIRFWYGLSSSEYKDAYTNQYTQNADAEQKTIAAKITQNNNMLEIFSRNQGGRSNIANQLIMAGHVPDSSSNSAPFQLLSAPIAFYKINITKVTGTYKYWIYGKRKWD